MGPFNLDHLVISVTSESRTYEASVEAAVERAWQVQLGAKPQLFDGDVWVVNECEVRESEDDERRQLQLQLQRSSYKYLLYFGTTHEGQADLGESRRMAGVAALMETSDGYLVVGHRSLHVGTMPGYWHYVPSGQLDEPDPTVVIRKELEEEMGIRWDLVTSARLLACLDGGTEQGEKLEFLYHLKLVMDSKVVFDLLASAEHSAEHQAFAFLKIPGGVTGAAGRGYVPEVDFKEFMTDESRFPLTAVTRHGLILFTASEKERAEL